MRPAESVSVFTGAEESNPPALVFRKICLISRNTTAEALKKGAEVSFPKSRRKELVGIRQGDEGCGGVLVELEVTAESPMLRTGLHASKATTARNAKKHIPSAASTSRGIAKDWLFTRETPGIVWVVAGHSLRGGTLHAAGSSC